MNMVWRTGNHLSKMGGTTKNIKGSRISKSFDLCLLSIY